MIKDAQALGLKGDNTDESSKLNQLLQATPAGGALSLGSLIVRCDATIVLPDGVALVADNTSASTLNTGVNANTHRTLERKGQIKLKAGASIMAGSGSLLDGLLITRQGISIPCLNQAEVDKFSGIAIVATGDDVTVRNCLVLGFMMAFSSHDHQRVTLEKLKGDCTFGVDVSLCRDVPRLRDCHFWPYCTVQGFGGEPLTRKGAAYRFAGQVDCLMMDGCFSFGYRRGLVLDNANAATIANCGFDNQWKNNGPAHAGSIGIEILGSSRHTKIIGTRLAANAVAGIHAQLDESAAVQISAGMFWGKSGHGVLVNGGDVTVEGSQFDGISNPITRNSAPAIVVSTGNLFTDAPGACHNDFVKQGPGRFAIGANGYKRSPIIEG